MDEKGSYCNESRNFNSLFRPVLHRIDPLRMVSARQLCNNGRHGHRHQSIDHILELARLGERLTVRKMLGEVALYLDGKVVAFVCDNSLFIKPSKAAATLAPDLPLGPPYPGAKDYPVADELLDDPELLQRLIVETAALMPAPKEKKPAKKKSA